MNNSNVILTGLRTTEDRTYTKGVPGPPNSTAYYLIFNNGALEVPCDENTFEQFKSFWLAAPRKEAVLPKSVFPEEAEVFGGEGVTAGARITLRSVDDVKTNPPPPPPDEEDDWVNDGEDEDDGVAQL